MNPNEIGELLFGTGGVPVSAKSRSTEAGIERIAELGLGSANQRTAGCL